MLRLVFDLRLRFTVETLIHQTRRHYWNTNKAVEHTEYLDTRCMTGTVDCGLQGKTNTYYSTYKYHQCPSTQRQELDSKVYICIRNTLITSCRNTEKVANSAHRSAAFIYLFIVGYEILQKLRILMGFTSTIVMRSRTTNNNMLSSMAKGLFLHYNYIRFRIN